MDTKAIVLSAVAKLRIVLNKYATSRPLADTLSQAQRIVHTMLESLAEQSPVEVSRDLKKLAAKYVELPQRYHRGVINRVTDKYSIFNQNNFSNQYESRELDKIKRIILSGQYSSLSDIEIRDELMSTLDMTRQRALLLARNEKQQLSNALLSEYYTNPEVREQYEIVWDSTIDGSTREDHAAMHGRVANQDGYFDSPWGQIQSPAAIPSPHRYNCRCRIFLRKKV